MRKEDFHKGQTVYLYDMRDRRKNATVEDKIKTAEVICVGRSYISVTLYSCVYRFKIADNFREDSNYSPSYALYLSKEDIYASIQDSEDRERIEHAFDRWGHLRLFQRLTEEDKQVILAIIKKYENGG